MTRFFFIISITFFVSFLAIGQDNQQMIDDIRLYHDVYAISEVLDSTEGILMYEKYNNRLGGDTTRDCKNYACIGYVEDYYENGQLLHKGFYTDGQLTVYKNYYPNGQVERSYKVVDAKRSKMKLYYPSGEEKMVITYKGKDVLRSEDYYENGFLEYVEEWDKGLEIHKAIETYYQDGNAENILRLENKKTLYYKQTLFFKDGQTQEMGGVVYDRAKSDYYRVGSWEEFNREGKMIKEKIYLDGKVIKEKTK